MENRTCCFTGHRLIPHHQYAHIYKALKNEIINLIERGYCYFGTGGALGFDTLAAQVVLELRRNYPHIKLILVLPCIDQTREWSEKDIAVSLHEMGGCGYNKNRQRREMQTDADL